MIPVKSSQSATVQIRPQDTNARAAATSRTAIVGALVNVLLCAGKIGAGIVGHSQALIADGIHSLSDLLSDLLVLLAGRHAIQGPDPQHPYGRGRYETVATLLLGFLLITVAIGIAWDATHRLFSPKDLLNPGSLALAAALVSILVKEWLYWWTLGYAKRVRSDLLRANAWHHRTDAVSSVVVLVGIAGTMAGLPYLDGIATILVALMIAQIAWGLGWSAVSELVDAGLQPDRLEAIRETIRSVGGVRDIHMLRTRRHAGEASADVHVLVDPAISVSEGHMISLLVEQRLKREIDEITDVTVHIDPEDDDKLAPRTDLPLRAEVMARLASLWSGIPAATERQGVVLHYLGGRIDVDVFFPRETCIARGNDPELLRDCLAKALSDAPEFGALRVFFG
jgi:cation diffusion facilitator family transporter